MSSDQVLIRLVSGIHLMIHPETEPFPRHSPNSKFVLRMCSSPYSRQARLHPTALPPQRCSAMQCLSTHATFLIISRRTTVPRTLAPGSSAVFHQLGGFASLRMRSEVTQQEAPEHPDWTGVGAESQPRAGRRKKCIRIGRDVITAGLLGAKSPTVLFKPSLAPPNVPYINSAQHLTTL
jgi:hypothetical protein